MASANSAHLCNLQPSSIFPITQNMQLEKSSMMESIVGDSNPLTLSGFYEGRISMPKKSKSENPTEIIDYIKV